MEFTDLSNEIWEKAGVPNVEKIKKQMTFEFSVSRRNIEGGTGPDSVKAQFEKAKKLLQIIGKRFVLKKHFNALSSAKIKAHDAFRVKKTPRENECVLIICTYFAFNAMHKNCTMHLTKSNF